MVFYNGNVFKKTRKVRITSHGGALLVHCCHKAISITYSERVTVFLP